VAILPEKMLLLQLQQVYSSGSKPCSDDRMSAERDTNLTTTQPSVPVSTDIHLPLEKKVQISILIKGELVTEKNVLF